MPNCPSCADEFEVGVTRCPACGVPLLPEGADPPPSIDALLGTFHPLVAVRLSTMLAGRRIPHEVVPGDGRHEVLVDRTHRDDLRAELLVSWTDLVGRMDTEEMYEVIAGGGSQPGWFDAPSGGWVDRAGRLQVGGTSDEEHLTDARRLWGPTLVALGAIIGLFGWYGQSSTTLLVAGGGMVVLGLLLPV
jgi:hypothetical protein